MKKKIFLFFLFAFIRSKVNTQNINLNDEILDAIDFTETDSTTIFYNKWKMPIMFFGKESVRMHLVTILNLDGKRLLKKVKFRIDCIGLLGIPFYNKDISLVLESMLSHNNFYNLLDFSYLYCDINTKAINFLNFSRLTNEESIAINFIDTESFFNHILCKE